MSLIMGIDSTLSPCRMDVVKRAEGGKYARTGQSTGKYRVCRYNAGFFFFSSYLYLPKNLEIIKWAININQSALN